MSDIDVLDTDDDIFQDSGSEYLPNGSNRLFFNIILYLCDYNVIISMFFLSLVTITLLINITLY